MLYRAARPLLFALEPETAHRLSLRSLDHLHRVGATRCIAGELPSLPVRALGLEFPNPVGLAAGLDKNGEHVAALAALGFGFVEVGTVTLRPQPGQPRPRLFRLPEACALINRLGFNSRGADAVAERLREQRFRGILGINVGRNADTPNARAAEEYCACMAKLYPHASYFTVNVSSPNTLALRELQQASELERLLAAVCAERDRLARAHGRRAPLAVKVSPDLDDAALDALAERIAAHPIEAVIATNTTVAREGVAHLPAGREAGGLSGAPLRARSTAVIAKLRRRLPPRITIIGSGGIFSAADAREKLEAGATLVQLYTGLVYRGPALVGEILRGLASPRSAT